MPALIEALSQLSDGKLDGDCIEKVLAGLEVIGARQLLGHLRNALLDAAGDAPPAPLGQGRLLAQACQELCWEKIHTGNWREVDIEWRDAYTLCCLVCTAIVLAPGQPPNTAHAAAATAAAAAVQPSRAEAAASQGAERDASQDSGHAQRPPQQSPAHGAADDAAWEGPLGKEQAKEALRLLDMAALMGGPLLRPAVDGAIQRLQRRIQGLGDTPSAAPQPPSAGPLHVGPPPAAAKKRRLWGPDAGAGDAARVPPPARHARGGPVQSSPESAPAPLPAREAVPLPAGSLSGAAVPMERLPSLESFLCDYMLAGDGGRPVIITGAMDHWQALERWRSPDYFQSLAGMRTVPVEVGRHYLAEGWGQRLMPLSDFIEHHLQQPLGAAAESSGKGYLAQHPLFDQIPELRADLEEPEYCVLGQGELQSVNAWFGPPGTVTPLHHDPYQNLLAQVLGRKYVRLYPATATAVLRPHEGMNNNSSQVDLDEAYSEAFPGVRELPVLDCILEPGQMLYIPPGWWHYVKSLSVSFSVSFWWQ